MNTLMNSLSKNVKEYGIVAALIAIVILFQVMTSGRLLAPNNVASLIQQNAYVMILAIGMTMVIIARHIDLSVGSVVAFVGGVVAILIHDYHVNWLIAVVIALILGMLIGCWQGFWVAYVGVPAFIVTLGGMLIFRGMSIVLVEKTVSGLPTGFVNIANGSILNFLGFAGDLDVVTLVIGCCAIVSVVFGAWYRRTASKQRNLPVDPMPLFVITNLVVAVIIGLITYKLALSSGGTPIVLVIIGFLVVVYTFVMNKTVFGRHIYAVGGNLKAAELSGIKTKHVDFMVFVNMGVLSALAGVVTTSRAGAAVATAGNMYELDAIAAAFIGGTAVSGGVGKISGAIIGALIMGVLNMGLSIMSVDSAWQQAIKGLVVLIAVSVDLIGSRRK